MCPFRLLESLHSRAGKKRKITMTSATANFPPRAGKEGKRVNGGSQGNNVVKSSPRRGKLPTTSSEGMRLDVLYLTCLIHNFIILVYPRHHTFSKHYPLELLPPNTRGEGERERRFLALMLMCFSTLFNGEV